MRAGRRPGGTGRWANLFDQFLGAAETDPVLAEWFLRRFSLLDSLYMVPIAGLVGRTIRHNMRLWLAERRAARPNAAARWLRVDLCAAPPHRTLCIVAGVDYRRRGSRPMVARNIFVG